LLFISSSRVYPHDRINALPFKVEAQRFVLDSAAALPPGVTSAGLSTEFGLPGRRTLYGASKLAAELVVQEFADVYNIPSLILRLGVIAGPWQMGKLDQGFVALWVARHLMGRSLNYCGFGGQGRQLRDVLHVDDAADLVGTALSGVGSFRGEVFNAGGGPERTVSLAELTAFCQGETARTVVLGADPANRPGDIPWYVTDNTAVAAALQWRPTYSVRSIVADTSRWLTAHPQILSEIFDA
jgi:CDP-paratose 2-epimerase